MVEIFLCPCIISFVTTVKFFFITVYLQLFSYGWLLRRFYIFVIEKKTQGGANVGLAVWVQETQFILGIIYSLLHCFS